MSPPPTLKVGSAAPRPGILEAGAPFPPGSRSRPPWSTRTTVQHQTGANTRPRIARNCKAGFSCRLTKNSDTQRHERHDMYAILRVQKHNAVGSVGRSGKHKDREQDTPNADPALTHTNETEGAQTAAELVSAVQARVDLATIKATGTDKPVIAVEYLITASPEFFKDASKAKVDAYFDQAKKWLREKHGADNVVSITRHNDEKTPHLSAFVVPLVEHKESTRKRSIIVGKDEQGKPIRETRTYSTPASINLSAKHFFGDAKALSELQTDFHSKVALQYGLERGIKGSRATHQSVQRFYANIEQASVAVIPDVPKERLVLNKTVFKTTIESDERFAERVAEAVSKSYEPTKMKAYKGALDKDRLAEVERAALDYRRQAEPILKPFQGLSQDQATDVLKLARRYQQDNAYEVLRQKRAAENAKAAELAKAEAARIEKAAELARAKAEREAARKSKSRGSHGR